MKLSYTKGKASLLCLALVAASAIVSCTPDESGSGNGLTQDPVDAAFTVEQGATPNDFTLRSSANNGVSNFWDLGYDEDRRAGSEAEPVFYPDAGVYTVTHTITGRAGTSATTTGTVTVTSSAPGNLALGGTLDSADDISKWTVLNISNSNSAVVFADGKATFTATGYAAKAIYQPITVQKGKNYKVNMQVSTQGVDETWFEVYVSPTAPTQGADYSAGGMKLQISTWAGCFKEPTSGWMSKVGCGDNAHKNVMSFDQDGTVYLVIKSGGGQNSGISVDNITFREIK